jgi:FMN reductase
MQICVLVGNPRAGSRTRAAGEALAARLSDTSDSVTVIDLADHAGDLFAWPSGAVDELIAAVASSDVLIVSSPTYKATYTGLLKAFLDRYGSHGLRGVTAIPLMTGASATHAMAPDTTLRPLLVELGACVPGASLYVETPQIDSLDDQITEWLQHNGSLVRATALVSAPKAGV